MNLKGKLGVDLNKFNRYNEKVENKALMV